ncbi:MAG: IS110 family transposase [Chthoniobacteraceae bacterium]
MLKLGVDVHSGNYVVVAQWDHATPRAARRFLPQEFVPWVEGLRRAGHAVHAVDEACGFGDGLQRALEKAGAPCVVIHPQRLDEAQSGVKTDPRDALTLCLRLGRYLDGNKHALAVIRIPSEAEEQRRHAHRMRESLVHQRTRLAAQGRGLLVHHSFPAPAHWWRGRGWKAVCALIPAWLSARLEIFRPVLAALETQIAALSAELEAAAPAEIPAGIGKLTTVIATREVCDWQRFENRRQIASYTGLCPGEYSSGKKRIQGSVTKHGNGRLRARLVELAWRMVRFQPGYPPVKARLHLLGPGHRATGAARKKAITAVARHLAIALWRLHTGRATAAELGLRMNPGADVPCEPITADSSDNAAAPAGPIPQPDHPITEGGPH